MISNHALANRDDPPRRQRKGRFLSSGHALLSCMFLVSWLMAESLQWFMIVPESLICSISSLIYKYIQQRTRILLWPFVFRSVWSLFFEIS